MVLDGFGHDVRKSRMDGNDFESDHYHCPWMRPPDPWITPAVEGVEEVTTGGGDDGGDGGDRGATPEVLLMIL